MKRRDFLKSLPLFSAPLLLNGMPLNALGGSSMLTRLASAGTNDRIIVLIQLHGGNDGLNTIVPMDQYSLYYNLRPNIAIPDSGTRKFINLDSTLPIANQVGLHPDMKDVKALYDQGKMSIVQGVAYENLNQSHFRSRDIWFMGGDADDYLSSGWMGRYLDTCFPNYPDNYPNQTMPDPPAIEVGTAVSLAFHRDKGIPMSVSINDPIQFFNLVNTTGEIPTPVGLDGTYYKDELRYIMQMDDQSNGYAEQLRNIYQKGANSPNVTYPTKYPFYAPIKSQDNHLSAQLKMIARLLSGGIKTKIFLARMGGFDTHANQVQGGSEGDRSMGSHAALLYHLSSAMKAFQDDLKGLGLEDRVMTVTFSEFGRRPQSNNSYGTDHGTSAPMFVFGKCVNPGVIGTNPSLNDLDDSNLKMQFDYRQVFTTLLQDWMGADTNAITHTQLDAWVGKKLDLVACSAAVGTKDAFVSDRFRLNSCSPNPVKENTTFSFYINAASFISIKMYDTNGKWVMDILNEDKGIGNHEVMADLSSLPPGAYIYKIESGNFKAAKSLIKL